MKYFSGRRVIITLFLVLLLSGILFAGFNMPRVPGDFGCAVHFRNGHIMRLYQAAGHRYRYWITLDKIDPLLVKATLACEDRRFYFHPGVDILAVARAAWQDLEAGRVVSGGSTITLQLARLLDPGPRTLFKKLKEAFQALLLETRFSKKEILERYLNLAPYGGNREGVATASLYYFGKLPRGLTPAQIAFLVSLPQAPRRGLRRDVAARNRILARLRHNGLITPAEATKAFRTPLVIHPHPFPFRAPHAADYLYAAHAGARHIVSTLDAGVQGLAVSAARRHRERLMALGATQAAVVVISNKTRAVRALVGSLDYWNTEFGGQVRGFNAPRSPGSALKPFLYAMALQKGILTPETRMEDRPKAYGAFRPVNFSPRFRGLVPVRTALALSLNLPFINLLRETGVPAFLKFMKKAGFSWGKTPGLTAVTGGVEVKLLRLTNLYATLARGGRHGPPRLLTADPLTEQPLLLPGAASLTLQALDVKNHGAEKGDFDISWKTGTSWGQRDAWAIGVSPQYTVGVWAGNFDGRGALGLTGARAALPLMLDIITALRSRPATFRTPAGTLEWIKICPDSGLPAGPFCSNATLTLFPAGAPRPPVCTWHRAFLVERETGYRACPWKRYPLGSLERRIYLVPPDHAGPPFSPACAVEERGGTVRILSPTQGTLYLLSKARDLTRGLPLKAETDTVGQTIYWFVNGKPFTKSLSGATVIITPPRGNVKIGAMDETGHWSAVRIWVSFLG